MKDISKGNRSIGNKLVTILFLAWVPMVLPFLGLGLGHAADYCSKTSDAALSACLSDVETERSIAFGNCYNIADAAESRECKKETRLEASDGPEDCYEQFEARQEICEELGREPYAPVIDPPKFVEVTSGNANQYMSLVPGPTKFYEGGGETIEVTVTGDTKEILGVECTVVRDIVYEEGELVEDTYDWFAQDVDGNVWYFGELSMEYEDGELASLEGSWKAGVDGAKPGIVMPGDPSDENTYRQEFLLTEAEDMGRIIETGLSIHIDGEDYDNVIKTEEWTPIEPDVLEHKYYAPGVGMIKEVDVDEFGNEGDEPIVLIP